MLREYATDLFVEDEDEVEEKVEKSEKEEKPKSESKSKSESKTESKSDNKSKVGEEISKEDYGEKKELIVDQIHQFRESQKR